MFVHGSKLWTDSVISHQHWHVFLHVHFMIANDCQDSYAKDPTVLFQRTTYLLVIRVLVLKRQGLILES